MVADVFADMCFFFVYGINGSNIYEEFEGDDGKVDENLTIKENDSDYSGFVPHSNINEDFKNADYFYLCELSVKACSTSFLLWGKFEQNNLNEKSYTIKTSLFKPDFFSEDMECGVSDYMYNLEEPVTICSFKDDGLEWHSLDMAFDGNDKLYCIWKQKFSEENEGECHLVCYVSDDFGKTWAKADRFSKIIKISDTFEIKATHEKGLEIELNKQIEN